MYTNEYPKDGEQICPDCNMPQPISDLISRDTWAKTWAPINSGVFEYGEKAICRSCYRDTNRDDAYLSIAIENYYKHYGESFDPGY
jgi:hypothetical protein